MGDIERVKKFIFVFEGDFVMNVEGSLLDGSKGLKSLSESVWNGKGGLIRKCLGFCFKERG